MPTFIKRKKSKPKQSREDRALSEALNKLMCIAGTFDTPVEGVLTALDGREEPDSNLVAEVAGICHEVADLGPQVAGWLGPGGRPSAEALYDRSVGNRRIMFLELVAWAIVQIEQQPPEALSRFTGELEMSRRREWRELPWPGAAKDEERLERHVLDLARTFTGSGEYALRR
ncbi:MAG TPA: hypothetical protein VK501_19895 [Baekduia sp.]|uniref:hypothetical protein n=1 Tax=Baekduia sp. TaxID=2600305 RepID=UPI002C3EF815|nr:hypothetical protein [Baekduia sp.]HMJ36173.1 hypothetical protein [Baekduia sp.]